MDFHLVLSMANSFILAQVLLPKYSIALLMPSIISLLSAINEDFKEPFVA